jgi:WD40 repeat protein
LDLGVAFSPNGRVALAGGDRVLKLWDVATGKMIRDLGVRGVHAVAFSPDGRTVLANDSEKTHLDWHAAWTGQSESRVDLSIHDATRPFDQRSMDEQ